MQTFVRGQRAKISQLTNATRLSMTIGLQSARLPIFDFVCFGLDAAGKLSDDRYMVFFNQTAAPDNSIALGTLQDQQAQFSFDLALVPTHIARLVFTVSIDGAGVMRDLSGGSVTLEETNPPQNLVEYRFAGTDFAQEGALMLAEIYRKDGEWRFWAQGQGFAGNLSTLLRHFGGQEVEETSTAPAQSSVRAGVTPLTPTTLHAQVAPTPPAPPPSSSATSSAPLPTVPLTAASGALHQSLAHKALGEVVTLARGEHQGPLIIDKPLTIEGSGSVIWAQTGPVVVVQSAGVTLRNLEIEVTAPDEGAPHANVALWVAPGTEAQLQNVYTRGEVVGVAAAAGEWKLPASLDLGEIAPRLANTFQIEVQVPQSCHIKASVAGVFLLPSQLEKGQHTVVLRVEGVGADTFLAGNLEFLTGGVVRVVPLTGRTSAQPRSAVQDRRL